MPVPTIPSRNLIGPSGMPDETLAFRSNFEEISPPCKPYLFSKALFANLQIKITGTLRAVHTIVKGKHICPNILKGVFE